MNETVCLRIKISGMVQGVGFRYQLRKAAISLGLCGWVRNNADGSVTALIQGSKDKVLDLVDWSRKGPPMSVVTDVDITEKSVDPELTGFNIVYR